MNKLLLAAAVAAWAPALPGYHFAFPRDHASHPAYRTEWWYYTGHLKASDGKRYGYELTFFRFGTDRSPVVPGKSKWRFQDLYLAHFALSDLGGHTFTYGDRLSRPGLGLASAATDKYDVQNGTWRARLLPDGKHHLRAREGGAAIDLVLAPGKPPVEHGAGGISKKSDCESCASHYYSLTRMPTTGVLTVGGRSLPVEGQTWMDHEFGSDQLSQQQTGWDWFALQLTDGSELMLYRLRLADGRTEPMSSGTYVRPDGTWQHLPLSTWSSAETSTWLSPHTGGRYPSGWHVKVPGQQLELDVKPAMDDQELVLGGATASTYWEGAVDVTGSHAGKPLAGEGYVELTGYAPRSKPAI